MENYALYLLKNALRDELTAKATATEVTRGNGFAMNADTKWAFSESLSLANQRIPQLKKAIELIEK